MRDMEAKRERERRELKAKENEESLQELLVALNGVQVLLHEKGIGASEKKNGLLKLMIDLGRLILY